MGARVVQLLESHPTLHLGDITIDGQNAPDELMVAAAPVRRWPTPMRCVPGVHDLGGNGGEEFFDQTQPSHRLVMTPF